MSQEVPPLPDSVFIDTNRPTESPFSVTTATKVGKSTMTKKGGASVKAKKKAGSTGPSTAKRIVASLKKV
jgi:hypothetical protein